MDLFRLAMPRSDDLLGWFVETTLVASALATLAVLAARVPRLAPSPAARHALWLIVLIKMVTPPLVHWPWSVTSPITMTRHESVILPTETKSTVISGLAAAPDAPFPGSPAPEVEPRTTSSTLDEPRVETSRPGSFPVFRPLSESPGTCVVIAWLVGSITIGRVQARGISRFRRLLLDATPAPAWLSEEAELIGRHLSVRVPPILVVPRLGTPVLWCLGRPVLLVPDKLLQTLETDRWGAIVAHELAHLRRGDHWVRRLELFAGLVWWWNPLYWLVRNRLDFEAELACDAWAVWASPRDRFSYAESLLRICTTLSSAESPSPALGIIGTGRSFERRLTMILRSRVDRRVSAPSLLAGLILATLALPSWTLAQIPAVGEVQVPVVAIPAGSDSTQVLDPVRRVAVLTIQKSGDSAVVRIDDDDQDKTPSADKDKDKAKKEKQSAKLKASRDELTKQMEALAKEMEAKFGPGSEFVKEIEKEFGPDSDFVKKMETFEKEMKAKFGPDSEFAKKMEALEKEMKAKFGPDSEFAKEMKEGFIKDGPNVVEKAEPKKLRAWVEIRAKTEADRAARANAEKARDLAAKVKEEVGKARAEAEKAREGAVRLERKSRVELREKAAPASEKRARRIEALESLIDELMEELKQLKAESAPSKEAEKP
jgi:beta-lactamase regulating signal transducer with metallopeptidase domain